MILQLSEYKKGLLQESTTGIQIIQAVDQLTLMNNEVSLYGYNNVLACVPCDLYKRIKAQEQRCKDSFLRALKEDKNTLAVDAFVSSISSMVRGYKLILKTAKENGLIKLNVDYFEVDDGEEFRILCRDEAAATLIKEQMKGKKNVVVFTMDEALGIIEQSLTPLDIEIKKTFNARYINLFDKDDIPF